MPSPASTSHGTGNPENSSVILVQQAPGSLGHSGTLISHPYSTTGVGSTFTPPSISSSTSVGRPSNELQRMGSPSSRSMIARFVFPRRRDKRHTNAPSTLSQGSSRMSQIGTLQPPPANVGHLPRPSNSSLVLGSATPELTPYILPPLPQGSVPGSTSHPQEKRRINPLGYTSPDTAIPSPSQPISGVQAHTAQPPDTDINRMIVTAPASMSPQMLAPPSYMASQAEGWEEQLRRAASNATARTRASSGDRIPEITSGPLSRDLRG